MAREDAEDSPTNAFPVASQHEPLAMSWKNVHFRVKTGTGGSAELLRDVSGSVAPGEILAIMGPSGAGKSTMLNVLASRAPYGQATGSVLINGQDPGRFTKKIAYVMQEDALFGALTPRETLDFTAGLKLPGMSADERAGAIDSVLDLLGLRESADRRIASIPGEAKRVAVAVELVSAPSLIFLDEPTSHLDAYSAYTLVKHLRSLARAGKTVVCTIHQPSSEVFETFDKVMLLSRGKCVYNGPVSDVVSHFASVGMHCRPNYNPADFAMRELQVCTDEELAPLIDVTSRACAAQDWATDGERFEKPAAAVTASFPRQVYYLTRRDFQQTTRDHELTAARFGMALVQALLVGLYFMNSGSSWGSDASRESMSRAVRSHWSAVQFMCINAMFLSAQPMLLAFPNERPVFIREYATGTYSTAPYFLAKTLVEVPASFLQTLLGFLVAYWMIDFQGNFFYLTISCTLLGVVTSSTALIIGAATTRTEAAMNIAPIVYIPQMIASGVFLTADGMPAWVRWVQWICPLKYGIGLASIAELDARYVPESREPVVDFYMKAADIDADDWWTYAIILSAMFFIFRGLAAVILSRRAKTFA
ncbi:ABC transporter G family member 7 [Diplonema papillatum]|nr:ABC transporter G family member 7 [Diplonema papillatum]